MAAEFDCIKYDERNFGDWESFVDIANNGTIFHTRRFLSYHPRDRFEDHSLVFLRKGKWAALFPAILLIDGSKRVLHSHGGASFGGFVLEESSSFSGAFGMVECLLDFCKHERIDRVVLTPPPLIYQTRLSSNIDFALLQSGFTYLKREVSSVLSLKSSLAANIKNFKPEARTAFRKAIKMGIEVRESDDFDTFWGILKNNLWTRHNVTPTHTVDEIRRLKTLFPEEITLLSAFLDDKMVAGIVLFACNPKVLIAFYISHDQEYQQYRAVNLLFHEVIRGAIKKKFKFLDYGIFTVDMEPNWGLGRFKESFGASGLFRDTFQIDI